MVHLSNHLLTSLIAGALRGNQRGDVETVVDAIYSIANLAVNNSTSIIEIEVNLSVVRPAGCGAVAVDAVIHVAGPDI